MRNIFLAAGVAALAISAPAASKPDENKGQKGGGHAAHAQQGGGQKANRGGGQRQEMRANRGGGQQMRGDRGQMRMAQAERGRGQAKQAERGRSQDMRPARQQARQDVRPQRIEKAQRQDIRSRGNDRAIERMANRGQGKAADRMVVRGRPDLGIRDDNSITVRDFDRWQSRFADNRALGLINGCPPGLAKKTPACIPPGQAKKLVGTLLPAAYRSSLLPADLRDYWRDDDDYYYRYNNDGYLYRVDRDTNLIASLLPLFGGGYALGQPFPYQSSAYAIPSYYQPFYQDTPDMWYRYDNGYVYGIDPYSGMIDNIIPTYDYGYGVGQMLPASYSYYNLPYPYRSHYADNNDYYYRYAPGAIYQVDRDSQLISAVVSLLGGGLGVGQQLPLGYSAYNVPLSYRDRYYDTPDNWYRYSNGYIYQVDPTTQLITAVIDAIV